MVEKLLIALVKIASQILQPDIKRDRALKFRTVGFPA
jgi:hypothetical protein